MNKQDFKFFIGIDLSKRFFDVAIIDNDRTTSYVFENTRKGANAFIRLLKNQKIPLSNTLICMEHTGVYGKILITKLVEKQASFCVEMPIQITKSIGVVRGKSDRVDAKRIAIYASKNHKELELYRPMPEILEKVKILLKIRRKLVNTRADVNKYPNELELFSPELGKLAKRNLKKINKNLNDEINRIEAEIKKLVLSDDKLNKTVGLVTSVTGIGQITALHFTIFTNFFTRYDNPKQLACYSGVVPFEYTSGESIHRKSRVHPMANRTLKKHLHMSALAAINHDPDIRTYFLRKVEEGKNKMLIVNNVRNKLVHRICAVVKRQKPYVKTIS
ncbi:IS110 family transposase [Flagellimonas sp. CMM7]|uniref:IS110 family transposase n=1 Tax=Flagellimonas sp. CMM7 TaxID=2654676 RepID=UPI0013D74EA5|nr:IS110 family transposase [Flagellimonas sp. CMM7]UII78593.1 IS110 family transposase [Flagellimonas sp. CMM7]UII78766.1 IS110 family transposase [Flagellimonas sp. CMM7]UII80087.1 IS110 family transposase [Flagellimonas sp. CMM7]